MHKGTYEDLRDAGKTARDHLKKHGFRHVVYAYTTKKNPDELRLLDWDMHGFETDADFNFWLNNVCLIETVYAVHALQ